MPKPNAGPTPLAAVEALATPTPPTGGPLASVAPTGDVDTLAQILVRFKSDLLPLERLESPDEAAILAHFSIVPTLPGHFRFLTPRMIGFQADRAWPAATRVRVTIAKGLRDESGRTLDDDVSWTFQTSGIDLSDLPGGNNDSAPRTLTPTLAFTADVPLDRDSLLAHAHLRKHDDPKTEIALGVPPDTASPSASPSPTPDPATAFDPSDHPWRYVLAPKTALERGTGYDLVIDPGVMPRDGNLASAKAFTGFFATFEPLAFRNASFSKPGSRFTNGDPQLTFTTPIDDASLAAFTLSPAPPDGVKAFATSDTNVLIATNLLAPNTDYTVTIGADARDTFGQTLGKAATATFRTGDLLPDVWAPGGTNLFPSSRDVRLNIVTVNPPSDLRAIFQPLAPNDVVLYPDPNGDPDKRDLLKPAPLWPAFDARGELNVERTIAVPLREKLHGPSGALAYGVAATLAGGSSVVSGVVQLTDLGVFAQSFPNGSIVRVNRISNGAPVANADVEIYRSQAELDQKSSVVPCAHGVTDATGEATFVSIQYAACALHPPSPDEAPSLVTIVRAGSDWTYVRTTPYSGAYSGDFYNGWPTAKPLSRGTIFSDRALYQPGETAQLTAIGWFLADGALRRGIAASYALTLEAPDGTKRDLGRRSLDAFGTFALPVALDKHAPLGYYVVRASSGIGEEIVGDFRVAEFTPPNFKVDLSLDRTIAARGETVNASTMNAYLFGAPLGGASTKYTVTRSPAAFTPNGRDAFTFGRQWFWPEEMPDASTDVVEQTVPVDAQGKNALAFAIASDVPYAMTYRVDAETTDVANLAVADSRSLTVLPNATLIGLAGDDIGTAGTPLTVRVIATDAAGKALAGTNVHVELQAADYASATQIVEGTEQPNTSVSYATVAAGDVVSAGDAVTLALTPPKPGFYRLRATLAGATGDAAETDASVYVGGSGQGAWFARDPSVLTVKLDKATYRLGETVTALVQSPFPDAEIHVAVVRNGVIWQTTVRTQNPAPTIRIPISPGMLPNAAVEAFAVRRGPPPPHVAANDGNALARVGFAPFEVALDGKYLDVAAHAAAGVLAPGAHQTVRIHLADRAQAPLSANATVIVANDAVLQLTGYRPPDLVKLVYADQPIATRYADNRAALVLETIARPLEKGFGYGGGLSGDDADPRVRHAFSPLAYFAGAVRTDAHGDATVTFTLPDDLTTWRVMVVAETADGRFGNGETTFRTTKPVVANPVMPQFARPGDTFSSGAAVTNGTGAAGSLTIDASLTGPLAFLIDGKSSATTSLSTPLDAITKAYRFPIVAAAVGTSTATVRVRSAAGGDAFAIPVDVRESGVTESVVQLGTTTSSATAALNIAKDTPVDSGGLTVDLASSLIPDIRVAANAALTGDERLTISAASRLWIASDVGLRERAATEVATLRGLQRTGGGFAPYWQATAADPWDSLVALTALARAHAAGFDDGGLLAPAKGYGAAVLADPTKAAAWCKDDRCKAQLRLAALDALAAAGDVRTTGLDGIVAQREHLDFADQVRLARLLHRTGAGDARTLALVKTIDDKLATSARGAVVNLPARYAWFGGPVVAQAQVLQLALERRLDGDTIDRLTRGLLDLRRNGSFGCACETANALDALVAVDKRDGNANFTATVKLGTTAIASGTFAGTHASPQSKTVAARALPTGTSTVTFAKTGSGTLHYAMTYTYRIAGAAPGRFEGLRITRIVRPAGSATILGTFGLAAPSADATLAAGSVYDVELEIISDHHVDRVAIADALPAGLQAVDTTFATTSRALAAPSSSWSIGDRQLFTDHIEAYADSLDAGVYQMHYLARGVTPGTFAWPGAEAHLIDRPEEFGRSAAAVVEVK